MVRFIKRCKSDLQVNKPEAHSYRQPCWVRAQNTVSAKTSGELSVWLHSQASSHQSYTQLHFLNSWGLPLSPLQRQSGNCDSYPGDEDVPGLVRTQESPMCCSDMDLSQWPHWAQEMSSAGATGWSLNPGRCHSHWKCLGLSGHRWGTGMRSMRNGNPLMLYGQGFSGK